MKAIKRILVPTDFSECSVAAARFAAALARQFGAAIDAVTVVDTSPLVEAYGDETYRNERVTFIRDRAREQLTGFVAANLAGLQVVQHVRDGDTYVEIDRVATELECGLVVMGTHGRTGLAHLLVGSVAEKVVRHSSVPVVTVRSPASG
ncbi:universal stress protein [Candidatus Binatia bacterium]|nr:universal stress protein [Candidatus Binatia bacterium]